MQEETKKKYQVDISQQIPVTLTLQDWEAVLSQLAKLPFHDSFNTITRLQSIINPQVVTTETEEPDDTDVEDDAEGIEEEKTDAIA